MTSTVSHNTQPWLLHRRGCAECTSLCCTFPAGWRCSGRRLLQIRFFGRPGSARWRPARVRHLFRFLPQRRSGVALPTADDGGPSSVRQARSAGGQVVPQPVDCVLSEWSAWSRCDTCQKKRVSATFQQVMREGGGLLQPFTLKYGRFPSIYLGLQSAYC